MFKSDTIAGFSSAPVAAHVSAVVAVPVCNERQHVAACLAALDGQRGPAAARLGIVLFLNNCTDGTADVIAAAAPSLSCALRVVTCDDPAASAGWARRRAMNAAAAWLDESGGGGVLLTTDADSRVPPDWVARNVAALDAGADAVAGRLALDPADAGALPEALHARGALEAAYEALLTEIAARIDPAPGNPWPTHWCRSGASLATRLSTYREIGGMPDIPCGEDRAFVEAMLARDRVVRHDPDLVVVTSGRLLGRAKGGVADTIRLRCDAPDSVCDDRLEPLARVVARALLGRRLRRLHVAGRRGALRRYARALAVEAGAAARIAGLPAFGAVRAALEAASPRLTYRPLRPAELPRQIRLAKALVKGLAALASVTAARTRAAGTPPSSTVTPGRTAVGAYD